MTTPLSSTEKTDKAVIPMGRTGVQLRDLAALQRLANMVVASGMAPKGDNPAAVAVKIQLGLELGLPPMTALSRIAVINGRPSIFGDAGKALLLSSGLLAGVPKISWSGAPGTDARTCTVKMRRKGLEGEFSGSFSIAQAKKAKLWGKSGPWTEYPDRQQEFRAWWYAAREGFADVLGGVSSAEESLDLGPLDVAAEVRPAGAAPLTLDDLASNLEPDPAEPTDEELAALHASLVAEAQDAEATTDTPEASPRETAVQEPQEEAANAPEYAMAWDSGLGQTYEPAFAVCCGHFMAWCKAPTPEGTKLAKRAATWEDAVRGEKGGGRHALLMHAVNRAQEMPPDLRTVDQERAACCLAMVTNGLPAQLGEPAEAGEGLFE